MIFAVGKEINIVTFKTNNNDIKLLRIRAGIYHNAFFTSRLEKAPFS